MHIPSSWRHCKWTRVNLTRFSLRVYRTSHLHSLIMACQLGILTWRLQVTGLSVKDPFNPCGRNKPKSMWIYTKIIYKYLHDINYTLQLLWIELGLAPLTQINLLVLQSHIDTTIKKRTGVFKIRVYEENVKWPCFVLAFGGKLINS